MTVGFIINTCEPFYRGGYERRTWAFARELARQGHGVRIYTSCSADHTIDGVRFVRLAAPRNYFNARGVRNGFADLLFALGILALLWKLRKGEIDVLEVCATPFLHLSVAAFVARRKRTPLVLTCHEALFSSLPDYVKERGHGASVMIAFLTQMLAGIYRLGMSLTEHRIAVSERTAAGLAQEKFLAEAVIEFGLEPGDFREQLPEPIPSVVRFIFCGRLTPIKAVDRALEALFALRGEVSFHFDVVGEGSEMKKLKSMVAAAQAQEAVTFHGGLDDPARRDLLARSEVFILSSPREGFSIATLEAMAQGCCAVVVSDPQRPNGALDFVQDGENGLCVAPGPEPMREALRRVSLDAELRLRLRRAALTRAQDYRIEAQTARLLEYYDAVRAESAARITDS